MNLINGKDIATAILSKLKSRIAILEKKPKLGIIQIGNDTATQIYVDHKVKDAEKIGIETEVMHEEEIMFHDILKAVQEFNQRKDIHGYIIQLPIDLDGDLKSLLVNIDTLKDVDGMNPSNLGLIWQNVEKGVFLPATVLGIKECLKHVAIYSDDKFTIDELTDEIIEDEYRNFMRGKNVVIINHSIIVGRPLAGLMLNSDATVTICHKETENLTKHTRNADILISATGRKDIITVDMIKEGAVVIDVGIIREGKKVFGDVDFENVKNKVSWITPVPGGIGPLTRAMLLKNVYDAFIIQNKIDTVLEFE